MTSQHPVRCKINAWLLFTAAVAMATCAALLWIGTWIFVAHRTSPPYKFALATTPEFLTEAIALEKAWLALQQENYDTANWSPQDDKRTQAPDGRPDAFLFRSTPDGNRGTITFYKRDDWMAGKVTQRLVTVELCGSQIVCKIIRPK